MSLQEPATNISKITGKIHSIESFGLVDGPGVRAVVFMQGCPMRCLYCHNPDTWETSPYEEWEAKTLLDRLLRFRTYWRNNGGITVSGGEPMLQAEFVTELFRLAKQEDVSTALDTSGCLFTREAPEFDRICRLLEYTDLVMLDLKQMNAAEHKKLTGFDNAAILDMARYLSDIDKPVWIRKVLVPGLTDSKEELLALKEFVGQLKNVKKFELLPYHAFAIPKYDKLGIEYALRDVLSPTEEQLSEAKKILEIE